eukprot:258497_1
MSSLSMGTETITNSKRRRSSVAPGGTAAAKSIASMNKEGIYCRCGERLKQIELKDSSEIKDDHCEICHKLLNIPYGSVNALYCYKCEAQDCFYRKSMDLNQDGLTLCELCAYTEHLSEEFTKTNIYPLLIPLTLLPVSTIWLGLVLDNHIPFYLPTVINILYFLIVISMKCFYSKAKNQDKEKKITSFIVSWKIVDQFELLTASRILSMFAKCKNNHNHNDASENKAQKHGKMYIFWFYFCSFFLALIPLFADWNDMKSFQPCHADLTEDLTSYNSDCIQYRQWLGTVNIIFLCNVVIGIALIRNLKFKIDVDVDEWNVFVDFATVEEQKKGILRHQSTRQIVEQYKDKMKRMKEVIEASKRWVHLDAKTILAFAKHAAAGIYTFLVACSSIIANYYNIHHDVSYSINFVDILCIVISWITLLTMIRVIDRGLNVYNNPYLIMNKFSQNIGAAKQFQKSKYGFEGEGLSRTNAWFKNREYLMQYEIPQYYELGNPLIGCLIGSLLLAISIWLYRIIVAKGDIILFFDNILDSNLVLTYFLLTPIAVIGTFDAFRLVTKPYDEQRYHKIIIEKEIMDLKYCKVKIKEDLAAGKLKEENIKSYPSHIINFMEDILEKMEKQPRFPTVLGFPLTKQRETLLKGYILSVVVGLVGKILSDRINQV